MGVLVKGRVRDEPQKAQKSQKRVGDGGFGEGKSWGMNRKKHRSHKKGR
jgi:hypothetical protein